MHAACKTPDRWLPVRLLHTPCLHTCLHTHACMHARKYTQQETLASLLQVQHKQARLLSLMRVLCRPPKEKKPRLWQAPKPTSEVRRSERWEWELGCSWALMSLETQHNTHIHTQKKKQRKEQNTRARTHARPHKDVLSLATMHTHTV